jgi:pyruvate formate lyase activating enzyme
MDACGRCLGVCPRGALTKGPEEKDLKGDPVRFPQVDKSLCDDCGLCAAACIYTALYLCGADQTVDEVMGRVLRDKPFFDRSGGGLTVSGGECLCQPDFTLELLRNCKDAGIHTAVDTTGYVKWDIIAAALPYTDLFLYDLKCMDSALHQQVIGVPNELILENARKIAEAGGRFWIRIPVIPGLNETEDHFSLYGDFLSSIKEAVDIVQLLPYHSLGLSKHERLLRREKVFVVNPPADSLMEARKEQLQCRGLKVRVH